MTRLAGKSCTPQHGPALDRAAAEKLLAEIHGWALAPDAKEIRRTFSFENYYRTIAFVNAVAWIANREDHHPDLSVGYGKVTVAFSTHSVGGLSDNDFVCAAKIDALGA